MNSIPVAGPQGWDSPSIAGRLVEYIKQIVRQELPPAGARLRYGTVTQVSPLNISLGADPTSTPGVSRLASYAPTLNDQVAVLQSPEGDLLCLGKPVA